MVVVVRHVRWEAVGFAPIKVLYTVDAEVEPGEEPEFVAIWRVDPVSRETEEIPLEEAPFDEYERDGIYERLWRALDQQIAEDEAELAQAEKEYHHPDD